jgi:hypothetical protein
VAAHARWAASDEQRRDAPGFFCQDAPVLFPSGISPSPFCESAIWRPAPFTADAKNPDLEKGFRDALIAEMVTHFVARETREVNIAFLCDDFLPHTTVAERLKAEVSICLL